MNYRFVKRDLGKGHRGIDNGDCQVRALALAMGITWPAAWELLYAAQGRHKTCGFLLHEYLTLEPELFGVIRRLSFPAERGKPRMTAREFAGEYPKGSFILRLSHHVAAMEDGTLYDRWDCGRKCVYNAWEFK